MRSISNAVIGKCLQVMGQTPKAKPWSVNAWLGDQPKLFSLTRNSGAGAGSRNTEVIKQDDILVMAI